jgi:hypothetical protein
VLVGRGVEVGVDVASGTSVGSGVEVAVSRLDGILVTAIVEPSVGSCVGPNAVPVSACPLEPLVPATLVTNVTPRSRAVAGGNGVEDTAAPIIGVGSRSG